MLMPVGYPQLNVRNVVIAVPELERTIDGDHLFWLYRNPQYVDAVERNLQESTELSELLENMNWPPDP
jgi:hypothetical protein